jgi:hypothetical protein
VRLAKQFFVATLACWGAAAVVSMIDHWAVSRPTPRHEFDSPGSYVAILFGFIGGLTLLVSFAQCVAAFVSWLQARPPRRKNAP